MATKRTGYPSDVSDEEWSFWKVTAANERDRAPVGELANALQEVTGQNVQVAFVTLLLHSLFAKSP